MIGTPAIGVIAANPEGLEQGFEFQQCSILPPTEDIREYPACLMIERSPQPSWVLLAANKRPHLIQFRRLHLTNYYCRCSSLTISHKSRIHLAEIVRFFLSVVMTVVGLTPSTRAVSRMPLPLSAISTICRLTSGNLPVL